MPRAKRKPRKKGFKCTKCDLVFRKVSDVSAHARKAHPKFPKRKMEMEAPSGRPATGLDLKVIPGRPRPETAALGALISLKRTAVPDPGLNFCPRCGCDLEILRSILSGRPPRSVE